MCVDAAPSQSTNNISIILNWIITLDRLRVHFSRTEFLSDAKVNEADTSRGIVGKMKDDMFWFNITMNNTMRIKVLQSR
jgi:hypothetical protein